MRTDRTQGRVLYQRGGSGACGRPQRTLCGCGREMQGWLELEGGTVRRKEWLAGEDSRESTDGAAYYAGLL